MSSYLPLAGGTLTGALSGTSASFSGKISSTTGDNSTILENITATTGWVNGVRIVNTGGLLGLGLENSTGGNRANGTTPYATYIGSYTTADLQLVTNNYVRLTLNGSTGAATFASNITALTGFFSTLSVAGYTYTSSTTITGGYLIIYGSGGSSGQTLTLPAASGTNQQLFFKNLSANSVTISRAGSDNLIALLTSTTSTTLTLLSGGQCGFVSDGGSKWIQQF